MEGVVTAAFFAGKELEYYEACLEKGPAFVRYSFDWLRKNRRPLYLFGAGRFIVEGVKVPLEWFEVQAIIDNNPALQGQNRYGYPVVSLDEAWRMNPQALVVVTVGHYVGLSEVMAQAKNRGFETVSWYECEALSEPQRYAINVTREAKAAAAFGIWADAESRDAYRAAVRYKAGFDCALPLECLAGRQYFTDLVPKSAYRNFVDVGAFNGDTLLEFLGYTHNDFDNYYAFEPLRENLAHIRRAAQCDPRVHAVIAAVCGRNGRVGIADKGEGSFVDGVGGIEVDAVRLDSALQGKPVSIIKMDIEGAEPEALEGAVDIISRQRPALLVSVYHRIEHLWELPLWIVGKNLGYRLFLRIHGSDWHCDIICYATPTSRA